MSARREGTGVGKLHSGTLAQYQGPEGQAAANMLAATRLLLAATSTSGCTSCRPTHNPPTLTSKVQPCTPWLRAMRAIQEWSSGRCELLKGLQAVSGSATTSKPDSPSAGTWGPNSAGIAGNSSVKFPVCREGGTDGMCAEAPSKASKPIREGSTKWQKVGGRRREAAGGGGKNPNPAPQAPPGPSPVCQQGLTASGASAAGNKGRWTRWRAGRWLSEPSPAPCNLPAPQLGCPASQSHLKDDRRLAAARQQEHTSEQCRQRRQGASRRPH